MKWRRRFLRPQSRRTLSRSSTRWCRPAWAGVPAPRLGAGPHRPGPDPVPHAVARLDPDLAQPHHADRMGRALRVGVPRAHGGRPGGVVIALLVASHWVLDFVTHRPD